MTCKYRCVNCQSIGEIAKSNKCVDSIPREERVEMLKRGFSGKEIEKIAVERAGFRII